MYVREVPQGKPAFLGILASASLYLHQDMRWFGEEMGSVVNNQKKKIGVNSQNSEQYTSCIKC